jgi:tRNA 2-thiouridine synthesizing protein E
MMFGYGAQMGSACHHRTLVLASVEESTVATLEILGKTLLLDKDGHLANFGEWSEEIASELAVREGVGELTAQHWVVIKFMRKVHEKEGEPPSIRRITQESRVDTKTLYQLFPNGPGRKAAKIAGLPRPKSCI